MAQVQTTKGAPRGAKREIEQKAGIGVRDLVTVAVFSVIYFIIFFACGCLGFVPVMAFLFPLPLALVSGIPQMLFYTKVRSFGMVTIMGALLGLLAFLMGYGPIGLGFGIVFGLIADLILRTRAPGAPWPRTLRSACGWWAPCCPCGSWGRRTSSRSAPRRATRT